MTKPITIIEINGQSYDALTGAVLHLSSRPVKPIDSVQRPVSLGGPSVETITPAPERLEPLPAGATPHFKPDISRPGVSLMAAHAPVPAHTLMRSTVKKPPLGLKRQLKAQTRTDILVKQPVFSIEVKSSVQSIKPGRLQRATKATQSDHIKKFHSQPSSHHRVTPEQVSQHPVIPVKPAKHHKTSDSQLFEDAIKHATSHLQPAAKPKKASKTKRRTTKLAAAGLIMLVMIAVIAYQQSSALTMRMAGNKAGFAAVMPAYRAAGFHIQGVQADAGVVAVQFHSNSDARSYTVTEKPSNWDSASLLEQFVRTTSDDFTTLQTAGRTIYVYGQHNATWVSSGVWYQVQADGALSNEQLSQLASSL